MQAIVNVTSNFGIGLRDRLLVSIPEDLRRFRTLTTGRTVICGRRTLETFPGKKPLKNRRNLILSHDPSFFVPGAEVVHSLPELFAALRPDEDAFVIGGASVYETLLPYCSRILLTETLVELPADRFFPDPSTLSGWKIAKTTEAMQSRDPRMPIKGIRCSCAHENCPDRCFFEKSRRELRKGLDKSGVSR